MCERNAGPCDLPRRRSGPNVASRLVQVNQPFLPVPGKSTVSPVRGRSTLLPGTLVIVATPIGNLGDVTRRAIDSLSDAAVIACEDTRVTAKLLSAYGIHTPMLAYHEHNAARVRPQLIERLKQGQIVALVSDAGTPLISDPGYKLVEAAIAEAIAVTTAPGASAPADGFGPVGPAERPVLVRGLPAAQGPRPPDRDPRPVGSAGNFDLLRGAATCGEGADRPARHAGGRDRPRWRVN